MAIFQICMNLIGYLNVPCCLIFWFGHLREMHPKKMLLVHIIMATCYFFPIYTYYTYAHVHARTHTHTHTHTHAHTHTHTHLHTYNTVPGAPAGVSVGRVTSYSVEVEWQAPLEPNGVVTSYNASILEAGGSDGGDGGGLVRVVQSQQVSGDVRNTTFKGLGKHSTYMYMYVYMYVHVCMHENIIIYCIHVHVHTLYAYMTLNTYRIVKVVHNYICKYYPDSVPCQGLPTRTLAKLIISHFNCYHCGYYSVWTE